MAPIIGLKRSELITLLKQETVERALPIQLNWMGPAGMVLLEEGTWRVRALRCNDELADVERQKRVKEGDTNWMPEDTWPFYEPAEVLVESNSKAAFVEQVEQMDWPFTPDDFDTSNQAFSPLERIMRLVRGG